jgi:hypothetical protein
MKTFDSAIAAEPAVRGTNTASAGVGVEGIRDAGWGVHGRSKSGRGVVAISETDYGLRAHSTTSSHANLPRSPERVHLDWPIDPWAKRPKSPR